MATVKISGLPAASAVVDANEFEINEAGTSKKVTAAQIAANTLANLDGDKGDITVASSGTSWTIDNNSVTTDKINNSAVTTDKINNNAVTNDKLATVVQPIGKQTVWVPASAMTPRTTNGAESVKTQLATNGTVLNVLAFDTSTVEYAQFNIRMPKGWNESTVTFAPVWTANSTSTNGVAFSLRAKALGNDETIDAAWGTAITVTDNNTSTVYQVHLAAESAAVTVANASELEWVVFEVAREVANGSDTLAVDALLIGVNLYYTTNAANDA